MVLCILELGASYMAAKRINSPYWKSQLSCQVRLPMHCQVNISKLRYIPFLAATAEASVSFLVMFNKHADYSGSASFTLLGQIPELLVA